jgi:hypothetical protein
MAGYSGRPLVDKLGIKPDARVALLGAPVGFAATLGPLPHGARLTTRLSQGVDVAVVFTTSRARLENRWDALTRAAGPAGAVWVAWPKRASGVPTDMTDHVVRDVVLPTGWVDVKVVAIDDTWTGVRCVLRRDRRPP